MASRKRDPPFDTQVIHKRWQLALGRVKMQAKSLEDLLYELTTNPINLIARGTPTIRSKGERTERSYIAAPRTQISLPPKHSDHTITNRKSIQLPSSIALPLSVSATVLHDLHDKLRATEFSPLIHGKRSLLERAEDKIAKMARETREALKLSLHGSALITYVDLPEEWRNNPFVTHGYR